MAEPPVVDASPFIVLALSGWLDLLRLAGESIVVPRQVEREVLRPSVADAAVEAMRTLPWLEVVEAGEPPEAVGTYHLDAGEEAVLTWAFAHPGTVAILDDRRGRRVARALGIPVTGTLGLVVEARRRGVIPAARPVVEQLLQRTAWHLSPELVNSVLARVGE